MKTADPKKGQLWEMDVWSPEGNYKQTVLILSNKKVLDTEVYGEEGWALWECLVDGRKTTLPIWMFNTAELLCMKPVHSSPLSMKH